MVNRSLTGGGPMGGPHNGRSAGSCCWSHRACSGTRSNPCLGLGTQRLVETYAGNVETAIKHFERPTTLDPRRPNANRCRRRRYLCRFQPLPRVRKCNPYAKVRAAGFDDLALRKCLKDRSGPNVICQVECDPSGPTGRGDISMLERAIPVKHPQIALDEKPEARPSSSRDVTRRASASGAWRRLLRAIGEFVASGGPLS